MSDNWIALVPKDPMFIPTAASQQQASDRLAEIAPDADGIEVMVNDNIQFFDCGGNFERILCPTCHSEIPVTWWQDRMDEDLTSNGYNLVKYAAPCCSALSTLNQLIYDWPQAFGRFALDVMNPNIGKLDDAYKKELEEILGIELHVIYQHI